VLNKYMLRRDLRVLLPHPIAPQRWGAHENGRTVVKKKSKNIQFGLHRDIHMKTILYGWIGHLHFKNEEPIHNTWVIRAVHSTIAQLYIYIYRHTHTHTHTHMDWLWLWWFHKHFELKRLWSKFQICCLKF
jgi:hypothetical protein